MVMNAPRDMRDWMKMMERGLAGARSMPNLVAQRFDNFKEEQRVRLTLRPTFPVELTWNTAFYISPQGQGRARVVVDFPDVTKATDGTDIQIRNYELWGKDDTAGILAGTSSALPGTALPGITLPGLVGTEENQAIEAEEKPWGVVASSVQSYFRAEGFMPGSWWRFRVRAIGVSTIEPGDWSVEFVVQMAPDFTPPPQPTAPVIKTDRGVITVSWDGMSVLGAMPADFKYAILAHGTASSPTHEIARFDRGGGFKVVAAPYNTPQFFRLRAIDDSGNEGPWSEQGVGITTPLVDTDVILSKIDLAKTELANFDVDTIIGIGGIKTKNITVTEELTAAIGEFLEVKAGQIDVNDLWADTAFFGLADAKLFRGDAFEGKSFTGGEFVGTTFKTEIAENAGVRFDSSGIRAWSPGGTNTFSVDAGTGKVSLTGRFQSGSGALPFATIIPSEDSFNGKQVAMLMARDSTALSGTGSGGMWVIDATLNTPQTLNLRGLNGGGVTVWNSLTTSLIKSASEITVDSANDVVLDAGAGNTVNLSSNGAAYAMTSSAPANVYMHTTGQLFKSTSSLRYKTDVQPWDPDYRVLGIETYSWVDRHPVDPEQPLQRYYGHLAEQVHEVMPELAVLNEFGEPDAVQYERVGGALIPVIRDLVKRIQVLEGK
ncbi:minor tail protein [Arthrobacter phage BruhMoment]|nr:minor tail protein [Arthrobacter phage BruhMoment]